MPTTESENFSYGDIIEGVSRLDDGWQLGKCSKSSCRY